MGAAYVYALVTFASGVILLLAWLYVTIDNPRSARLLLKSLGLFVLPGVVIVALPDRLFQFPLSMWVLVLIEESLKAAAASTEQKPMDRFWLIALFGIWELMLAKPMWGIEQMDVLEGWTRLQLTGLTAAGMVTVLMHSVTAEIYAFRLGGRIAAALAVSWILHIAFNESIDLMGVSLLTSLLQLLPLLLLFVALWPKRIEATSNP